MNKLFNILLVALVSIFAITTFAYAFMRSGSSGFAGGFHGRTNFLTVSL